MSEVIHTDKFLIEQLKRSNKLYLAGYSKGYEDGIKYALDAMERALKKPTITDVDMCGTQS